MRDLKILQNEVGHWSRKNFGNQPSVNPLLGACEEVGELCHAHLKQAQGIRHSPLEAREMKIDAIGDIVIYLADYCELEGISLGEAVDRTWSKVMHRDWAKDPVNAGMAMAAERDPNQEKVARELTAKLREPRR